MAFPFHIYNIAYSAAGFKSKTCVFCNASQNLPVHCEIREFCSDWLGTYYMGSCGKQIIEDGAEWH